MAFVEFMRSTGGRALRVCAGTGLIAGGVWLGGAGGVALGLVGLVPLGAGLFGVCLVAPLFGLDLAGRPARR